MAKLFQGKNVSEHISPCTAVVELEESTAFQGQIDQVQFAGVIVR